MQYASLIENRRSVRAFQNRALSREDIALLRSYYEKDCQRLLEDIPTELVILQGEEAKDLEGAAGYEQKLPGAPYYLVLLTGRHEKAGMNAGFNAPIREKWHLDPNKLKDCPYFEEGGYS